MLIVFYSCSILIKLELAHQIFKKHSNTKFHENLSSGSHTDRYKEANSFFSQFCKRALR